MGSEKLDRPHDEADAGPDGEGGEARPLRQDDPGLPGYGMLVARESASVSVALDAAPAERYPPLVDRIISRLQHLLYALDDQRAEIGRLRENTRTVLARMGVV